MLNDTASTPTGGRTLRMVLQDMRHPAYPPYVHGFVDEIENALASAAQPTGEPVAYLWQHSETGRTRVVMPDAVITADATWCVVGPLVLAAAPKAAPTAVAEPSVWGFRFPTGGKWHYTEHGPNDRSRKELIWRPFYEAPQPAVQQGDAEDAARLDFMIEHRAYVVSDPDACPGYWLHFVHKETGRTWVQGDEHTTPRAAIDAARAAKEGDRNG